MSQILFDSEQFSMAMQDFLSSQKNFEDAAFRYNNLKKEFETDVQLQAAAEFPEIEDVCLQADSVFLRLKDCMGEMRDLLNYALNVYTDAEKKAQERINSIKEKSEVLHKNINDVAGAAIQVQNNNDEAIKRIDQTSRIVNQESFVVSAASTAVAAEAVRKNKSDSHEEKNIAEEVEKAAESVAAANSATVKTEKNKDEIS